MSPATFPIRHTTKWISASWIFKVTPETFSGGHCLWFPPFFMPNLLMSGKSLVFNQNNFPTLSTSVGLSLPWIKLVKTNSSLQSLLVPSRIQAAFQEERRLGMGSSLSTLIHMRRDDHALSLLFLPFYSLVHRSTEQQEVLRRQESDMPCIPLYNSARESGWCSFNAYCI